MLVEIKVGINKVRCNVARIFLNFVDQRRIEFVRFVHALYVTARVF